MAWWPDPPRQVLGSFAGILVACACLRESAALGIVSVARICCVRHHVCCENLLRESAARVCCIRLHVFCECLLRVSVACQLQESVALCSMPVARICCESLLRESVALGSLSVSYIYNGSLPVWADLASSAGLFLSRIQEIEEI